MKRSVYHSVELVTVICIGGECEICHNNFGNLHPHEWQHTRGAGGKVSLENSLMCCDWCHSYYQERPKELRKLMEAR